MALFESYERREKQILAVLKEYGINSIEECADICKAKGFDPYKITEGIQPICFENAKGHFNTVIRLSNDKNVYTDTTVNYVVHLIEMAEKKGKEVSR